MATKSKKATTKKTPVKKTSTKSTAAKKAAMRKSARPPSQKTTVKKAVKKATTKKAVAKKPARKKAAPPQRAKKPAVKKPATKKPAVKKPAAKKPVAKKAAAAKKAIAKKTGPKGTKKTVSKAKARKKVTLAEDIVEQPVAGKTAAKKTAKTAKTKKATGPAAKKATTKKATAKKATTKKATTRKPRKKATPKPREKVIAVGKVGQAPRRGADEVAASNPFPVPPQIHESVEEAPLTPSPQSKAAKKEFRIKDKIVYPAHGVGVIEAIESQEIVGTTIEVFVIQFDHEKLRLRVPTQKAKSVGMRELSDQAFVDKTIIVLQGRARVKRTMWSRRAQEYEAKINSGNLNAVAEVVRDLYRAPEQPEQSYSERQLFEAALDRMAREVAAVKKIDLAMALEEMAASLQKKQIAA